MASRTPRPLVLLAIAAASPAALALDVFARRFVAANQPDDVRAFLADRVTAIAWWFVPGPILGGALGFALYPRLFRRALARNLAGPLAAHAAQRADFEALFVATTMAQIPALLGDFLVILGGRWTPALCTAAACLAMIAVIGLFAGRDVRRQSQ